LFFSYTEDAPLPVLAVSPSWVSPGASVTLSCQVKHLSAGWSFYWYRAVPGLILHAYSWSYNVKPLPHITSATAQDTHFIPGETHTAGYVCRAGRGDPVYFTDYSEPTFVWSSGQFCWFLTFHKADARMSSRLMRLSFYIDSYFVIPAPLI